MVPDTIPQVSLGKLMEWKDLSFADLSFQIMSLYIDESEISAPALKDLVDRSYAVNPKNFREASVAPVNDFVQTADQWTEGDMTLLELFHGPTFAFKDVALQFLGNLFEHIYKVRACDFRFLISKSLCCVLLLLATGGGGLPLSFFPF